MWSLNDPKGKVSFYAFIVNNKVLLYLYCIVPKGIGTQHHRQFSAFSQLRSFCFCLMSSDAKSILGTIYKVSFFLSQGELVFVVVGVHIFTVPYLAKNVIPFFLHTSSFLLDKLLEFTEITGVTLLLPGSSYLEPTPCFCPPFYLCQLFTI